MNATRLLRDLSKSLSAFLLVALLTAATAFGQTIYVDAATGNDLWDGSSMSIGPAPVGPKATIGAAHAAAAASGTTIVVKAGTYPEIPYGGIVTVTKDVTLQVQISGINTKALINGLVLNNTNTLASGNNDITFSGSGMFEVQDANLADPTYDLLIQDGLIAVGPGTLGLAASADVWRTGVGVTDGVITSGTVVFAGNHSYLYDGSGTQTAGGEYAGNLGNGTLTVAHAGTLISIGATTAQQIDHTSGNLLFTGNVVETVGGTGLNLSSPGTATFNGTITHSADAAQIDDVGAVSATQAAVFGGALNLTANADAAAPATYAFSTLTAQSINSALGATGALTAGTTNVTAALGANGISRAGAGNMTFASLDLNLANLSNQVAGGTLTVTGLLLLGDLGSSAGQHQVRVDNDGVLTVGSLSTEITNTSLTDDFNDLHTIDNGGAGSVFTVQGTTTQASFTDEDLTAPGPDQYAFLRILNAANGTVVFNGDATISGDILNSEADGLVQPTDGIQIGTGATVTVDLRGNTEVTPGLATPANITAFGDFSDAATAGFGTLVINYPNGGINALNDGGAPNGTLTLAGGNLTFGAAVLAGSGGPAAGTPAITVGNNLTFLPSGTTWSNIFTVGGTVVITGDNTWIDGGAAINNGTPQGNWGGLNVTGNNCQIGTGAGDDEDINLTVAGTYNLGSCDIFGDLTATGSTLTGASGPGVLQDVTAGSLTLGGAWTITGRVNLTGNWTVNSGAVVGVSSFDDATITGPTSDIGGILTVNGTLTFNDDAAGAFGQEIRFGSVSIGASAPGITIADTDAGAARFVQFSVESSFVGGQFTDASYPGDDNIFKFFIQPAGSTFSPKPGFQVANFQTEGSGRTLTQTESITVSNDVSLGNDTILQLNMNSIVMSTALGQFILDDEAQVINDIVTDPTQPFGAVVFNSTGQVLNTTALPTSAPTLTNVVVNAVGGAGLAINNDVYIQGTFQLIDGGAVIATGKFVEFLNDQVPGGTAGRIYRTTQNEGITLAGTGVLQGIWDYVAAGTGGFPAGNADFSDPANQAQGINDLLVSPSAGATINLPPTGVSILGNFEMDGGAGSSGSTNAVTTVAGTSTFDDVFTVNSNFTSTGNVAVNANVTLGNTVVFTTPAKLDVAIGQWLAAVGGNAATVSLTGNNQDHDVDGALNDLGDTGTTTLQISGTGVVVDRDVPQSAAPTANESELDNVTLLAGATATISEMELINGNVLVDGGGASLTLTTTADATSAATEGRIAGTVTINNGGTLVLSANGTGNNVAGTMTVQSGGTLTQASQLTIGGAVTIGGGALTTSAAVVNQNGFNMTLPAGVGLTLTQSAAPAVNPSFLPAEGTALITVGNGGITGNADYTVIPNLTINGTAVTVGLVVDRAFTVAGASTITAPDEIRLSGKNSATYAAVADGFFAANLTGTGALRTLGTILQASANVAIDNLIVNSATETRLTSDDLPAPGPVQRTFTFLTLNHVTGSFDQGAQNVIVNGDAGAGIDWTVAAAADHVYQSDNTTAIFTVGAGANNVQSAFTGGPVTVNRLAIGTGGAGVYTPSNGDALVVATWFDFNGDPDFTGVGRTATLSINDGAQIHIYPSATIDVNAAFPGGTSTIDVYFQTGTAAIAQGVYPAAESVTQVTPTTFDDLYVAGGNNATLPDAINYQVNDVFLTGGGDLNVDGGVASNQTLTIADGGSVNYNSVTGELQQPTRVTRAGTATVNYNAAGVWNTGATGSTTFPGTFNSTSTTVNVNNGAFTNAFTPTFMGIGVLTVGDGIGAVGSASFATGLLAATVTGLNVNGTDGAVTATAGAPGITVNGNATVGTGSTYAGALTVNGTTTVNGTMTLGPLDANGPLTTGAGVAVNVATMVSGTPVILGGNFNNLTFDGVVAQALTAPANFTIVPTQAGVASAIPIPLAATVPGALTINNPAGVDVNGSIIVGFAAPAASGDPLANGGFPGVTRQSILNLTNGVLRMTNGTLTLNHYGSGQQGYTQGTGCVFGNVRKFLSNPAGIAANSANSDRMQYPLCSQTGTMRDYAFTIDNPSIVGVANASVTVRHDVEGQAGAAAMVGTNGLPQQVNGVTIGRYPIDPTFWWTVTPSWTMSANQTYNAELFAYDYPNFSLSCGLTACDINEIYSIDRENGSNNNLWSPSSTSINNYLLGADDVVVVTSNAAGDLNVNGSRFTLGLKTIFGAAAVQPTFATTTGNGHTFDLTTLFVGQSGMLAYTSITPADASCVVAGAGTLAGDNLTMTGGAAGTCATTVTVNATDEFGATASATFNVNNYPAPAGSANITLVKNVGDASVSYDLTTLFTGGAPATAFINPTPSANVTVGLVGNTFTINFPAATAGQEVVTVQMNDGASTPSPVATQTFLVTVNPGVAYTAGTFTNVVLTEGATNSQALAGKFTGGTIGAGGYAYAASSDATGVATSAITGTNVVSTAVGPYVIVAGVVTADAAPANVTVSATDDLGASAQGMFTVTVNPKAGNVSGFGPDPASANLTLDFFLGLEALTAKQQMAANFDGDAQTIPYDAAQIFNAWLTAKRELVLNPMAAIAYGDVNVEGLNAVVPVRIDGEASDVVSFSYTAVVDPNFAKVTSVVSAAEGWTIRSVTAEDGTITIAGFGLDEIPADGIVATINLTMLAEGSEFTMAGQGAVNANAASAIGDVIVGELPENFSLLGNYPNPFNPSTTISFDLPATAEVTVQVFDMLGRQVLVLPAQTIQGGAKRSVQLNGSTLASGSYFYRVIAKMDSKTAVENGRMLLVK